MATNSGKITLVALIVPHEEKRARVSESLRTDMHVIGKVSGCYYYITHVSFTLQPQDMSILTRKLMHEVSRLLSYGKPLRTISAQRSQEEFRWSCMKTNKMVVGFWFWTSTSVPAHNVDTIRRRRYSANRLCLRFASEKIRDEFINKPSHKAV